MESSNIGTAVLSISLPAELPGSERLSEPTEAMLNPEPAVINKTDYLSRGDHTYTLLPMETDPSLPEGWSRKVVQRENGKHAGKFDVYIYNPAGKRFRCKNQLEKYLASSGITQYKAEEFDFTVHGQKKVPRQKDSKRKKITSPKSQSVSGKKATSVQANNRKKNSERGDTKSKKGSVKAKNGLISPKSGKNSNKSPVTPKTGSLATKKKSSAEKKKPVKASSEKKSPGSRKSTEAAPKDKGSVTKLAKKLKQKKDTVAKVKEKQIKAQNSKVEKDASVKQKTEVASQRKRTSSVPKKLIVKMTFGSSQKRGSSDDGNDIKKKKRKKSSENDQPETSVISDSVLAHDAIENISSDEVVENPDDRNEPEPCESKPVQKVSKLAAVQGSLQSSSVDSVWSDVTSKISRFDTDIIDVSTGHVVGQLVPYVRLPDLNDESCCMIDKVDEIKCRGLSVVLNRADAEVKSFSVKSVNIEASSAQTCDEYASIETPAVFEGSTEKETCDKDTNIQHPEVGDSSVLILTDDKPTNVTQSEVEGDICLSNSLTNTLTQKSHVLVDTEHIQETTHYMAVTEGSGDAQSSNQMSTKDQSAHSGCSLNVRIQRCDNMLRGKDPKRPSNGNKWKNLLISINRCDTGEQKCVDGTGNQSVPDGIQSYSYLDIYTPAPGLAPPQEDDSGSEDEPEETDSDSNAVCTSSSEDEAVSSQAKRSLFQILSVAGKKRLNLRRKALKQIKKGRPRKRFCWTFNQSVTNLADEDILPLESGSPHLVKQTGSHDIQPSSQKTHSTSKHQENLGKKGKPEHGEKLGKEKSQHRGKLGNKKSSKRVSTKTLHVTLTKLEETGDYCRKSVCVSDPVSASIAQTPINVSCVNGHGVDDQSDFKTVPKAQTSSRSVNSKPSSSFVPCGKRYKTGRSSDPTGISDNGKNKNGYLNRSCEIRLFSLPSTSFGQDKPERCVKADLFAGGDCGLSLDHNDHTSSADSSDGDSMTEMNSVQARMSTPKSSPFLMGIRKKLIIKKSPKLPLCPIPSKISPKQSHSGRQLLNT